MRLSNHKETRIIPGIYYFSVVLFFLIIFLNAQLGKALFPNENVYLGSLATIVLLQLYIYTCGKYFEYDSEGQLVTIINKGLILSRLIGYRNRQIEINRNQIKGYKIYDLIIYKRLVIIARDNYGRKFKKHLNISFVKPKKVKVIRKSLNRLINKNHEAKV